jgi:hypothetical protein
MRTTFLSALLMLAVCQIASSAPVARPVPAEKELAAYLLVYFTDETHGLYMALSHDGYTFTDVNNGRPIMAGRDLAEQKGIRDVHIMRGPDGAFYLSMTDLHIFAQREGLRDTEWERDGNTYGWGNNRALIFMKSHDLVNWTHSIFRLDQAFPELRDIGCAWAPETIWDTEKNKPMVYFTMRLKNDKNRLYYAYADTAFTKLETKPELLFQYPVDVSYIDGDITKVGDKYHLFYVSHEKGAVIMQAVSDKINSGYVFDPAIVPTTKTACEAPNVWKRHGTDTYVVMYDAYRAKPNSLGFTETTDFVHFKELGLFNQGVMKATNFALPKHGAVISLTLPEAQALAAHWKLTF